uniref:acetyl-CoA C-acetyltransferase n=1 Tax=Nothoprocta perdicaria TaxID=30464 RepID=A0A8C7ED50_NOTPE
MERVQVVLGHLAGPPAGLQAAPCAAYAAPAAGNADDVVVVHGRRTAIGRSKRGGFKDTTPDELLSAVMSAVLQDLDLPAEALGDICVVVSRRLCPAQVLAGSAPRDCRLLSI